MTVNDHATAQIAASTFPNTGFAAVVCLFACTYSSVVAAYEKPTTTVRQLHPRRVSGSSTRMVSIASAARNAASCHAPKLQNLMAAPPLENRTAAAMIFDRGLMT